MEQHSFVGENELRLHLVEYVKACDDSGRLDTLRDVRAGEENMLWFRELIKIGQVCSSTEKRKRPPMQEVLGQFEKVKTEMSMVDNIRRLSNENPIEEVGRNLSPMELQLIYDFKKEGTSNVSENNKMLNISPERDAANSAIPLVIEQMKNFSVSSKENSNESLGSYIASSSSTSSESEPSTVSQKLINRCPERNVKGDFSFVKTLEADTEARVAPVPLISILQLQVSEFEGNSDAPDSEKLCNSKS